MLPNDANERNDKDINHELPSAREKKARSVSRSVKQIMMCHGPRVLSFIVATVVVLTVTMVPVRVSSHCCRALTLHVWVCDSITKRIEKFHQDYIFFYHIWVLTGVHAARHWEEKRLYGEGGVAMRLWCHHNTRKWFCWCCRWRDRHPSSQPDAAVLWF